MAEAIFITQDLLSCPVCLDLLKDPVTVPCGHSFCRSCINDCWDQEDQKGSYSCPQCRHTFTGRPDLNKNAMLAELADTLKKTKLQDAPPVDSYVGPGDVECDVCSGRKRKAVKSCLVCLLSFCEAHVQIHESPAYKKHKLVEASVNLQEKICPHHDKLLEAFCRTDQKLICLLCMDSHISHEVSSAEAQRNVKQAQLADIQRQNTERIQQGDKKLQELRETKEFLQHSAQAAMEDIEKLFTQLIKSIEQRRSQLKELIRAQEKTELNHIEELVSNVEQEIADLRRRDTELEQLSHVDDHIHFLQIFPSVLVVPLVTDISSIKEKPQFSLEFVKKIGSEMLKLTHDDLSNLEVVKRSGVCRILPVEPKTREEFLKYSCQLTLNPNTANRRLTISKRNTKVSIKPQSLDDFVMSLNAEYEVTCSEGLSKCCYWEVERKGNVSVVLSYKNSKNISGDEGCSWRLTASGSKFYFNDTYLNQSHTSSNIGVYLDHKAGILAFYSVTDKMELLHRVHTTFTQPLYPRFRLKNVDSFVRVCDLC
ncbi:E3 ubiquitin-protein ligase TRIM16-like [Electrophorus electricus]|uniref:E3 ubiquitin-protein ligase TRIM16-like n=1 Tax=Electrophorus electricus TaxID=8005 RepID=UPI0015D0AD10|nr:E3 ubiquitin-protein ligase TRIM16-like [Electrophorus electricus]